MKKVLLSLLLLAAAGAAAFFVKDALDRRAPDYAVARLTVTADSVDVPVTTAAYTWRFALGGSAEKTAPSIAEMSLPRSLQRGGEQLELTFSQKPESYTLRRSGKYDYVFADTDDQMVPFEAGGYVYEVHAVYPSGEALYYFYIVVQ